MVEYEDKKIDFKKPWKRINIYEVPCGRSFGSKITEDDEFLFEKADSMGINHNGIKGKALTEIFETLFEATLVNPTFVYGFPLDVSPLARKNDR